MNILQIALIMGQIAAEQPEASSCAKFLVLFAPFLVILAAGYLILRPVIARSRRAIDRSMEHMDRLESKTDEVIQLLRDIHDRLGQGGD